MYEIYKDRLDSIWQEAHEIFSKLIRDTKESDRRAIIHGAKGFERHRLHLLLDTAQIARRKLKENQIVDPWYMIELLSIIEVVKKWKKKKIWKEIEPSLKDKDSFMHTIGKLHLIELFRDRGNKVELVPRGLQQSPDLKIQASGGTEDWLFIECYQPNIFSGIPREISDRRIKK